MSRLCITLLGAFWITLDGENLTSFSTDKARALMAYLAVESHRPHQREHLAGLLWSDQPEKKALHSLRQSLSTLRKIFKDSITDQPFLLVNRETIQFNPESNYWLDVADFQESIDQGFPQNQHGRIVRRPNIRLLQHALNLYHGNFLDQIILKGSPLFDEWAILKREFFTRKIIEVMCMLVEYHDQRGEFEPACKIAEQIVALIPWEENAHQIIMRMLAKGGLWSAAEVQFQTLQRYLDQELGVTPSSETLALVETIRQTARQNIPFDLHPPIIRSSLPHQTTSFVGRDEELDQLWDILTDSKCRLLTLVGPGGIGKSRLALQMAREQVGIFSDGVFFVPLTLITSNERLTVGIAEAIGFSFYAPQDPLDLLIDHLRKKEMLLVLDNFEHLLAISNQSNEILTKILLYAPAVVILATSRQPINLRMEQIIELKGLTYPSKDEINRPDFSSNITNYSALQLFEQIARRVNPKFNLYSNLEHVVRICDLVEGNPLGIELAATWVRGYTTTKIVRQIERNIDFLATSMQDVPDRHSSMRSVLNHSWNLLSKDEKIILSKLSVFRGGFSLDAAKEISGATASHIHSLIDKSLLRRIADNRYDLHYLLSRFASEKLAQNPAECQDTCDSYSTYFASLIQDQEPKLYGKDPVAAQKTISLDIENIRTSWQWATEQYKIKELSRAAQGLGRFYDMRSWFLEGRDVFLKTKNSLQKTPDPDMETLLALGLISAQLGWFEIQLGNYQSALSLLKSTLNNLPITNAQRISTTVLNLLGSAFYELGEIETAKKHFEDSLIIATEEDYKNEMAFAYNYLGSIARNQGDFPHARSNFTESLNQYRQLGDQWGLAKVLNNLGNMAGISGDYEEAEKFFEKSLAVRRELNDQAGIASCLQNLSIIAFLEEDYSKAKYLREACLSICLEIGFTWGIASTLKHLGDVDKAVGNLIQARQRYTESLAISEQSGNRRSVAFTLNSLGSLALLQDEYPQASEHYQRALKTALDADVIPLVIDILMGMADLWTKEGKFKEALELITVAQNHPGIEKQTINRSKLLQIEIETHLSTSEIQQIKEQFYPKSLQELADDIISNKSD